MALQKHPFKVASFDKMTRLGYPRIDKLLNPAPGI